MRQRVRGDAPRRACAAGITPDVSGIAPDLQIRASAAAVKRALLNILLNATQHAGSGGRVTVTAAVTARKYA